MKYKKVFMKPLAYELRKLGYKIVKIEPNYNYPECNVYTFEVSGNFITDFSRLSQALKKQQ